MRKLRKIVFLRIVLAFTLAVGCSIPAIPETMRTSVTSCARRAS